MSRSVQDVRGAVVGTAVFTVVAALATWLIWSTLNNYVSGDTVEYSAEFTDASGLHEGDDVRIAGVKVGRIESMELAGATAKVDFSVRVDQTVYTNTRVQLRYQNLTGQRYLALRPAARHAGPLRPGSTIPVRRTDPSLDLTVLLGGLEPLFSVLDPGDINRLADNILALLHGEGDALDQLIVQAAQLTGEIADRDEIITAVLGNLADVLEHLDRSTPQFERLLGQAKHLVDGLNDESGPMFDALERVGKAGASVTSLVGEIRPSLRTDLSRFNQVAALFLRERDAVESTLQAFPKFLGGAARVTQHGSWMDLYVCRINVELPGLPPGTVGDLMGTRHTEVCR